MLFLAIALGVGLLPIQTLIDDLPKGPAGLNFQNIVTLICLVGWRIATARRGERMLAPLGSGNHLNKRMLQYMALTFCALWYGKLFHSSLIDWPISLSDDRVIKWKDEMTGFLLYFAIAATLRDEKQMKRLVFFMFATIPYIIGVYYVARNADSLPSRATLRCENPSRNPYKDECDIGDDDAEGNVTGKPGTSWADVELKEGSPLIVDAEHPLKVEDEEGNVYPSYFISKHGRIRIDGYNRFSRTTLYVRYHQGIAKTGLSLDRTSFSWALKEVRGVFQQVGTNEMGAWYVHALLFAVGILLCFRPSRWFFYLGGCVLLLSYGIVFSLSRAAYLAVIAAVSYLGVSKSRVLQAGFVAVILIGPVFLGAQAKDESAAHRLEFWKWAAYAGLVRYPVIGLGYGCYIPKHSDETGVKLDTHNFFFRTLAEMGPLGLFLVFAILWSGFKLGWSVFQDGHTPFLRGVGLGTALMVIGCTVGNMFGDRFSYISLNCWIFAMFGMSARARTWIDRRRATPSAAPRDARQARPAGFRA